MSEREKHAIEMRKLLVRWRKSGLSLREFGKQEGVSYTKLTYWKRQEEGGSPPRRRGEARRRDSGAVAPVRVVGTESPRSSHFEVRLRNGIEIGVRSGFDSGEFGRLLELVGRC